MPNARESNRPALPGSVEALRAKYLALSQKYLALVERLKVRATQPLPPQRLGSATAGGVALVERGQLRVASEKFNALSLLGRWTREGSPPRTLRAIVLAQAAALRKRGRPPSEVRLHSDSGETVLALRLERSGGAVLAIVDDVTEQGRQEHELDRVRAALLQQERLRMLGEVAASMAHDLAGSLRALSLRVQALEKGGRPKTHLGALKEGLRSVGERLDPLRAFARFGSLELGAVKLERIVEAAAATLELEAQAKQRGVRVDLRLPSLPLVRGSPAEVSHLFLNLLLNACDAMPEGGTVKVIAQARNETVQVQVSDQGVGIKPEDFVHLFEPFFTTKGSRGTGLGLWLVATTMRRIGGSIQAVRRKRGTTFLLTFAVAQISRRPVRRPGGRGG
jgi:signal transduction histidine kinase